MRIVQLALTPLITLSLCTVALALPAPMSPEAMTEAASLVVDGEITEVVCQGEPMVDEMYTTIPYLATLTINLAWQGWLSMRHGVEHHRNRVWHNLLSQALLTVVSANCLLRGFAASEPMMMGISMVGFATVATNLWFIYKPQPLPDRIKEHIKCLIGAGISVYTAFFAFGAVRLFPELALQPGLWAVPLVVGLILIIYHQRAITRPISQKWRAA